MKLSTPKPPVNGGESKARRKKRSPQRPSKKTEVLRVEIPRSDFSIYARFADYYGLPRETVMECSALAELEALSDDVFSNIASADEMPPMEDVVTVQLSFVPDAKALLELVARLLKRPVEWLLTYLVREDANLLDGQMAEAEADARPRAREDLEDWAKRVMDSDFEARLGRMPKSTQGFDAWEWLNLQRYRPAASTVEASDGKGGPKP